MRLFGCSHPKWVSYGGKSSGQQKCSKCGKLRNKRVSYGLFHTHSWKGSKRDPGTVTCKCGASKKLTRGGTNRTRDRVRACESCGATIDHTEEDMPSCTACDEINRKSSERAESKESEPA